MAIAAVQKVQIIATDTHKSKILDLLQDFGAFQVNNINDEVDEKLTKDLHKLQKIELDHANVEFAIKLLSPYEKKKGLLADPLVLSEQELVKRAEKFKYQDTVKECLDIEETIANAKNALSALRSETELLKPWEKLSIDLKNLSGTDTTSVILGSLKTATLSDAEADLKKISSFISTEKVNSSDTDSYLAIIFEKDFEKEVRQALSQYKFSEAEMPAEKGLLKDHLAKAKDEIHKNEETINKAQQQLQKLAKHLDDLKIAYDYLGWQKEKFEATQSFANTQHSFVINGWVQKNKLQQLDKAIAEQTKEYDIQEVTPDKDEKPPVIINNPKVTTPFETLTRMYGLPRYDELDPTPYLSIFFIIFFALCLTDAGYGIVMFTVMALALKFVKMGEGAKRLVKLLMYGGIVTIIIGALFGGWFGLLPEDMPEFLTYTTATGEKMFILQAISAISNPIAVLILALALGFIQILLGIYMKLFHGLKHGDKKATLMDTGPWAFMLTGIGFYILGAVQVLPQPLDMVGQWWIIAAAVLLILTQGRDKKNIFAKLISGILSLYGLVSYMSDVLSYSRLLALGLATSIIGLAVNVIVELFVGIPFVGWIFAAVVFVFGHLFNLVINTLGSFIHSGRLQFVEFFGKFMEGGGKDFKPFSKKSKYVYMSNK